MKRLFAFAMVLFCLRGFCAGPTSIADYAERASQLMAAATNSDFAFQRLTYLCDTFGPRFSGTTNLESAIDWVLAEMKKDGLENVHGEPVSVPHWVRGEESLELLAPRQRKLPMLGLGMSIGTPQKGIAAEVLVVTNFADLTNHAAEAKGRIVLINQPFTTYDETVLIRSRGAIAAASFGAVACLIRSVSPFAAQLPHTGMVFYRPEVKKIPAAAITIEDADLLQLISSGGKKVVVRLKMGARSLPDTSSRNVIGEIVGREKPDEVVIVSGHIDTWDVTSGPMDDGGGCIAAWEAVRLMHKLGLRPKRTVRVVLWTNEENGVGGAKTYREQHKAELDKHVVAIECDQGPFTPVGYAFGGSDKAADYVRQIGLILDRMGAGTITLGAEDTDTSKLNERGVPMLDLKTDNPKYMWWHHTDADTLDKLKSGDVAACAASLAVMSYILADMPEILPR